MDMPYIPGHNRCIPTHNQLGLSDKMEMELKGFSNLWWNFECQVCSAYELSFATFSFRV
jgi:hypothetical protein